MEMRLNYLNVEELPEEECRFVGALLQKDSIFGASAFGAEASVAALHSDSLKHLNGCSNVVVARVGSGGRFDGGGVGDQEFLVVRSEPRGERDLNDEEVKRLVSELNSPRNAGLQPRSYSSAELKDISIDDRSLLFHPSRPSQPYPGRVLESEFVAGNRDIFLASKRKVLEYIKNDSRKIIKKMKDEMREYRKCCETGVMRFKGAGTEQFGRTDSGVEFVMYDDNGNRFGFKYAYLRYFQTFLSVKIFQFMVENDVTAEEFVDLPPSVEERIRFFLRKRWVKDVDLIISAGLLYSNISEIQSFVKAKYYHQKLGRREIISYPLKKGSLAAMRDSVSLLSRKEVFGV